MTVFLDLLSEFASALAVVSMLAWCYGSLHRRARGWRYGPLALGAIFGVVAAIQMHVPIEPVEGMIIDLRVVPLVLAGAFLGLEGLFICMAIAVASRIQIGGIGLEVGIVAMLIAGLAGLAWSTVTSSKLRRGWVDFLALGGFACLSILGGLLLPNGLSAWFFTTMVPVLVPIYLVVIPLVALLMERARVGGVDAKDAIEATSVDPASGLVTKATFARRVSGLAASSSCPPVTSVLVLEVNQTRFLQAYWGGDAIGHVLSGLRTRIGGALHYKDLIGCTPDGKILLGLTAREANGPLDVSIAVQRSIAEQRFYMPDGEAARVTVSGDLVALSDPLNTEAVLKDLSPSPLAPRPFHRDRGNPRTALATGETDNVPTAHDRLFDHLEKRMQPLGFSRPGATCGSA